MSFPIQFQIGAFPAFLPLCAFAVVSMIRYTLLGPTRTLPDLTGAALASGCIPGLRVAPVR